MITNMKPILFNTEMVRAILEGHKTQTRRLIKRRQNDSTYFPPLESEFRGMSLNVAEFIFPIYDIGVVKNSSLYCFIRPYNPGDILYVRETWCNANGKGFPPDYYYYADTAYFEDYDSSEWKWKPSIHMPKEAARIFIRVTDVNVQRLREITEEDAAAEGIVAHTNMSGIMHRLGFAEIWNKTIKPSDIDRFGWNANPWVWVYTFERVKKLN